MHVVNEIKINKIVLIFRNKYCYSFYLFYILFIKKKFNKNSIIFSINFQIKFFILFYKKNKI